MWPELGGSCTVESAAPTAMRVGKGSQGTQGAERGAGSPYCLAWLFASMRPLPLLQPHNNLGFHLGTLDTWSFPSGFQGCLHQELLGSLLRSPEPPKSQAVREGLEF